MNEAAPKIEVFKPFGEAFELTKKILLQPFDIKKWCLIGFAAFLAGHFGGGFNFPLPFGNFRATRTQQNLPHFTVEQWRPWLPLIIFGFIVFILVFIVIVTWLKARGNFIFTDCIVRNRGAIAEPWREYRKEGNSYFKFQLAIMFASIVVFTAVALTLFFAGWVIRGSRHSNLVGLPIFMVLLFVLWIAFGILINVIMYFMAPVMYRQRCLAIDAFREVLRLLATNPTPFVLFCLFGLVLLLAMIVTAGIVSCVTCCAASLPYVGTVILLPVYVCVRAFGLLFLRQFGPDYDVWATLLPLGSPPISPASPV